MKRFSIIALLVCLALQISTQSAPSQSGLVATLPQHVGIGLQFPSKNWMHLSGVPWDYTYSYINTGWESWTDPAGTYLSLHGRNAKTNGYVFWATWYVNGSSSSGSGWTHQTSLESASYMLSYFTQYLSAMLQLQSVGVTVMHLEPDTWGLMQQKGYQETSGPTTDPTTIYVAVAASGFTGTTTNPVNLSDLPNNAVGFAQALKRIRDQWAPSVLLAYHASFWATDWNQFSAADPVPYADGIYTFYSNLKTAFDLICWDTVDRDYGYAITVDGSAPASVIWTPTQHAAFQAFLAEFYKKSGVPNVLWQIPVGNNLYRTSNNTAWHYQDNWMQTIVGDSARTTITGYRNAGVIAFLFGSGQNTDTNFWDVAGDAITNPAPINGNNLTSTMADDDGGYTAIAGAAFYKNGYISWAAP